jgi:hypothetical protein
MRLAVSSLFAILGAGLVCSALTPELHSQDPSTSRLSDGTISSASLPEAPVPQPGVAVTKETSEQASGQQTAPAPNAGTTNAGPASGAAQGSVAGQSSSATQAAPAETGAQKNQREIAEEQLKQQEKQRVMGVMATFNTTQNMNAAPLSPGQKFHLFFKSASDPWPFLLAGTVAGFGQATDSTPEWGQGMQGYAKRFGAGYSDYFIGNFFGNAVLPALLHEDPRYFQKGKGKVMSRILWAAGSSVWCRRDNGGWGPNYANLGGNFIGTAIGRVYHPPSERNVKDTLTDGLTVTVEGMPGAELIEFWPDVVRAHRRKQAEKQARLDAAQNRQAAQDKKPQPEQK